MAILKKTTYVESHELGVIDTMLQIGITWCMCMFTFYIIDYLKSLRIVNRIILFIGGISYELYLSHVLFLDWLQQNVTIENFIIYGIVVILSTTILRGVNYVIQQKM